MASDRNKARATAKDLEKHGESENSPHQSEPARARLVEVMKPFTETGQFQNMPLREFNTVWEVSCFWVVWLFRDR